MERLFQLLPWLEMRLPPRWNIYDLTRPRVTSGRLGFRRFDIENAKTPDLDAIPFDELFTHRREEIIDHGESGLFLRSSRFGNRLSEMFLRDRLSQLDDSLERVLTH